MAGITGLGADGIDPSLQIGNPFIYGGGLENFLYFKMASNISARMSAVSAALVVSNWCGQSGDEY